MDRAERLKHLITVRVGYIKRWIVFQVCDKMKTGPLHEGQAITPLLSASLHKGHTAFCISICMYYCADSVLTCPVSNHSRKDGRWIIPDLPHLPVQVFTLKQEFGKSADNLDYSIPKVNVWKRQEHRVSEYMRDVWLWLCVYIHVCISFLCAVGIPLPSTSESIMSLMNTMCLSSLCTWKMFIRSCPLKMKTPPHADLPLFEIDPNWFCQLLLFVSACESSLLLWGRISIPDTNTHTHTPLDVLVRLIIVFC